MSTRERTLANTQRHPSTLTGGELAGGPVTGHPYAQKPLPGAPTKLEASFYAQYPWCLNAFPTIREVVHHLSEELDKLDRAQEGWQQSEVTTNIFLLSCTIMDAVDDYLVGNRYDFSKISQLLPLARPGVQAVEKLLDATGRLRTAWLFRLHRWRIGKLAAC